MVKNDELVVESLSRIYMEGFVTAGLGSTGDSDLTESNIKALRAMADIEYVTEKWANRGYDELTRIFNKKLNEKMKGLGISTRDSKLGDPSPP